MKPRVYKYANGGAVHGAPMDRPKVGASTRKRPKVGDKDSNFKPSKRRKPPTSSKPPVKKSKPSGSTFRDYRGTKGVIDDASGIPRK